MITKEQWDALTPQQQYDLVQHLDAEVDRFEAERDALPDTSNQTVQGYVVYSVEGIPIDYVTFGETHDPR